MNWKPNLKNARRKETIMKLYNTLTRKKEEFVPLEEGKVKMYVCGPTVYDYIHIGNARPYVIFDTIRRYMEYKGYEVKYVQNFTDVDDKIINKAIKEGVESTVISERYIAEAKKDAEGLNVEPATYNPKVTEEMPEIIEMIKTLIEKGHAYEVMVVFSMTQSLSLITASFLAKILMTLRLERELKLIQQRKAQWTLYFGSLKSQANQHGNLLGAKVDQVGTLNVQ